MELLEEAMEFAARICESVDGSHRLRTVTSDTDETNSNVKG